MTAPELKNDDGEKPASPIPDGDGTTDVEAPTGTGGGALDEPREAEPSTAAPSQRTSGGGLEWLLARRALRDARASVVNRHPERSRRLQAARKAIAYGDAVLDPASPPRQGAAPELALSLYRDALGWLLAARTPEANLVSAAQIVPELDAAAVSEMSAGLAVPGDLTDIADWDWTSAPVLGEQDLLDRARKAKRLLHTIADQLDAEERKVSSLQVRRAGRVMGTLIVLSALVAVLVMTVSFARRRTDLAKGKPWRASSSADTCHPEKRQCTGTDTAIFFHTKEEESPWVEIDLGKPTAFTRTEIVNRLDCCTDRALPLVIEVSNDARTWKEVAKRTDSFRTWNANVGPQNARYVRARTTRKSILHLEGFSVR